MINEICACFQRDPPDDVQQQLSIHSKLLEDATSLERTAGVSFFSFLNIFQD